MKQIIIIVSLIGIYLSFTSCRPADNRQADYDFTPLDSIITSWMNKGYYPGASICVVRDDSVIFQKNYKDVTPDTKVYVPLPEMGSRRSNRSCGRLHRTGLE